MQKGVYATAFPGLDKTIYTLVNRDSVEKKGHQLELTYHPGVRYFDLWNGVELMPRENDNVINLDFEIESRGFGAVLAINNYALDTNLLRFLSEMKILSARALKEYSDKWAPLPQQIVVINKTIGFQKAPKGMVLIPSVKQYLFESSGTMIEGNPLPEAVGVQHPWQTHPSRSQKHEMEIPAFYMDKYPVTNKQFKAFIDATGYHPEDDQNFLKDWTKNKYPAGWSHKPVTWISIEDARAYAEWAGKRLPHEWEWQYAAQGPNNFLYPWGNKMDSSRIPTPDSSRLMRSLTNVDA